MTPQQLEALLEDIIVTCECGSGMGLAMAGDTDFLFICENDKCLHQMNLDFELAMRRDAVR